MARNPRGAAAPKPTAPAPTAPTTTEAAEAPPADDQSAAPPGDDATEQLEQPVDTPPIELVNPEDATPAPAAPVPDLDDFIAHHERAAQAVDLVVTAISHPDAKPRHHAGVYSGFPVTTGELSATYSDGSTR